MEDMIISVPGKAPASIVPEEDMEVTITLDITWSPVSSLATTYQRSGTVLARLSDFRLNRTGNLQVAHKVLHAASASAPVDLRTASLLRHTIARIVSADNDRVHAHLMQLWSEHVKKYFQV